MKYSHLYLAATHLIREGRVGAFEAVYQFTDPEGRVHRNTRLAATIWTLRTEYGWDIQTVDVPGHLAEYVLRKVGTLPRGVTGPAKPAGPSEPPWQCEECGHRAMEAEARLGGFGWAWCPTEKRKTMHKRVIDPV